MGAQLFSKAEGLDPVFILCMKIEVLNKFNLYVLSSCNV